MPHVVSVVYERSNRFVIANKNYWLGFMVQKVVFLNDLPVNKTNQGYLQEVNMAHAYNFIDLTGQKFNKLTVVEFVRINNKRNAVWRCRCDCGNLVNICAAELIRGHAGRSGQIGGRQIGQIGVSP